MIRFLLKPTCSIVKLIIDSWIRRFKKDFTVGEFLRAAFLQFWFFGNVPLWVHSKLLHLENIVFYCFNQRTRKKFTRNVNNHLFFGDQGN